MPRGSSSPTTLPGCYLALGRGGCYRFGFNGKGNDDEVHGSTGTSLDFGEGLYDTRVGRWLSLDPLATKYPQLSPYAFVGNNPISNREIDGRDFEVVVDDKSKTITLRAVIYVTDAKSLERAQASAASLMGANGAFALATDGGEYGINFDVSVVQVEPGEGGYGAVIAAAQNPIGNSFSVQSAEYMREEYENAPFAGADGKPIRISTIDGHTYGGQNMDIKEVGELPGLPDRTADRHEPFHVLGVRHRALGKFGTAVTAKVLGAILKFAQLDSDDSGLRIQGVKRKDTLHITGDKPDSRIVTPDGSKYNGDLKGRVVKR